MSGDLGDYLQKKATELGLERGDQLSDIQKYLDEFHPKVYRAASINNGVLKIITSSAPAASELRHAQLGLLKRFDYVKRLSIMIG